VLHTTNLCTIYGEGITDHSLYSWNWFAGRRGTNNNLTVAANSPFVIDLLTGHRNVKITGGYGVRGVTRDCKMYLLAEGIYPSWAIFCGPNHSLLNVKKKHFTMRQEATRKDVERLLGCLQGRFMILWREWFEWDINFVIHVSEVCVILQNMLVELRCAGIADDEFDASGNRICDENIVQEYGTSCRGL
jgi:Plant transposon protein